MVKIPLLTTFMTRVSLSRTHSYSIIYLIRTTINNTFTVAVLGSCTTYISLRPHHWIKSSISVGWQSVVFFISTMRGTIHCNLWRWYCTRSVAVASLWGWLVGRYRYFKVSGHVFVVFFCMSAQELILLLVDIWLAGFHDSWFSFPLHFTFVFSVYLVTQFPTHRVSSVGLTLPVEVNCDDGPRPFSVWVLGKWRTWININRIPTLDSDCKLTSTGSLSSSVLESSISVCNENYLFISITNGFPFALWKKMKWSWFMSLFF